MSATGNPTVSAANCLPPTPNVGSRSPAAIIWRDSSVSRTQRFNAEDFWAGFMDQSSFREARAAKLFRGRRLRELQTGGEVQKVQLKPG
jgi:hypothetical protein